MQNHFYAMMSRMKNIFRWGLMRNTRQENLSEHSLEVAQIAHALALINRNRFGGNANPCFVATAAMYHDTTEIITGDLPTPIKYYSSEMKKTYKQIEAVAQKQLTEMLPDDFRPDFEAIYNPDDLSKRLIKAADRLSALIKCIEEINMGNREFEKAKLTISKSLEDMKCAEAEVFLCDFIPSFALSLDEQREIK